MLTLTLDGLPVDLPADAEIALSYRSSDLRRLDTREAAFSETFALPITHQNARVLGHPHALTSQTTSPYRRVPAVLAANGVPVLRGVALLDGSADGYEITLLDDTADFFGRVGDKPLRTLNLSAYDHTYSLANTQAAQGRADGYTYALADEGTLTQRDPAQGILWNELTQAVYYRTVLEAIMNAALPGFTLVGSLLADATFAVAAFPRATATPHLRESARTPFAVQALLPTATREHDNGTGAYFPLVAFPRLLAGASANFNGTTFTTPPYPADVRVTARLLVRLDAQYVGANLLTTTIASIRVADSVGPVYEQVLALGGGSVFTTYVNAQPAGYQTIEFDFTLNASPASRGLALQLRLENGAGLTIGPGSTINFTIGQCTYAAAPVHLDASLPDISQADALKLICNQFNALIYPDTTTRTLRVDLFNDLEQNRARAVDWTTKLDYAVRPRVEYRLGEYAQLNTFAYQPAPKAYATMLLAAPLTAGPGTGTLAMPDRTRPAKVEAYVAPVALPLPHPAFNNTLPLCWLPFTTEAYPATPPVLYDPAAVYGSGNRVIYGQRVWFRLATAAFTNAGTPPQLTPVPVSEIGNPMRVAWTNETPPAPTNDELPTCALVVPLLAPSGLLVQADAPDATRFAPARTLTRAGLTFDTLLTAYHAGTAALLARVQLVIASMRLTAADIASLDFNRPVRLDVRYLPGYGEVQGLFYLNLIDQYRPGIPGLCRVELLRLGDPIPALAPAAMPLATAPNHALYAETGQQLAQQPDLATNGPLLEQRQ